MATQKQTDTTQLIQKYFPQDQWANAQKVMMGESGGRANAVGDNYPIRGQTIPSYGLFQIRALPGRPAPQQLSDPEFNVKYAAQMYNQQGWRPWTAAKKLGLVGTPTPTPQRVPTPSAARRMVGQIGQFAGNVAQKAWQNLVTFPQRNAEFNQRLAAGDPKAQQEMLMALPMLTVSTKGATVAKELAKRIHPEDILEMADFTQYARKQKALGKIPNPYQYEANIREMAAHYGINPEMSNKKLANAFTKILDWAWKGTKTYLKKAK